MLIKTVEKADKSGVKNNTSVIVNNCRLMRNKLSDLQTVFRNISICEYLPLSVFPTAGIIVV
jgi:hypothetical protein